jgi:Etoposide-induced protein 2.4 (EI24)
VNLFLWAYLPQVALLHIFHGPGAWLNAAVLVLGEGQVIIALLFEAFLVDETLVDIFDSVLINEGLQDLIISGRVLYTDADTPAKMLGKPTKTAIYSPFSLRQILEFIFFLPINFIPWVGVPIFLLITGYRAGPFHHWRYFKLLGLSRKERKQYIQRRKMKYTWFGTVALMLQLVPVLSMFFLLTSAAGSALWVVKMEKARREREQVGAPEDPYHDEPA